MMATIERPRTRPLEFELPNELEAREPPEARGLARDDVRLLVSHRDGDRTVDTSFRELPSFLSPGDLLVANDSATIPAALTARRADASAFALHLSTKLDSGAWVVEPRKTAVRAGEVVALAEGASCRFVERYPNSERLWIATLDLGGEDVFEYLARAGRPVRYPYVPGDWPIETYQTVYARRPGSAEMPSAGRPFSEGVLASLRARGVGWTTLTLHCGVASLESHEAPIAEPYEVPRATADAVNATRAAGGRVVAVGTTVVRALESAAGADGTVRAANGWTELLITPERGVRAVDALLTGFHEPKASHLAMLEAIAGRSHLASAYARALEGRYLWHEFGDVHLMV